MTTVRMERVILSRGDASMEFTPHSALGQYILDHEGIGMPDPALRLHVAESRDGAYFSGSRTHPRQVLLALGLRGSDRTGLETLRGQLQDILGLGQECTLAVIRNDGQQRIITVIRAGGDDAVFRTANRVGLHERVALRLVCPNPYFTTDDQLEVDMSGGATQEGTRVPTHIPTRIAANAWGNSLTVVNTGNIGVLPMIRMSGPLRNVSIANMTTDRTFRLQAGYTIPDGTTIVFEADTTRLYDEATGASVASRLDTGANIVNFTWAPGDNTVQVNTDSFGANSRVVTTFSPRFLSGI